MDAEALKPGDDFVDAITERLGRCDLMLTVIGRRWLTTADESGRPRLQNQYDYVRLEIETALARPVRTIPVLVEGAVMPRAEDLPECLQPLVRRQAIDLSATRWEYDIGRLIETIHQMTPAARRAPEPGPDPDPGPAPDPSPAPVSPLHGRPWMIRAAGVAAVLAAALLLWWAVSGAGRQVPAPPVQNAVANPVPAPGAAPPAPVDPSAPAGTAAPPAVAAATFSTAAGIMLVPVKADQAAVFEEMATQLQLGLSRSGDAALREQGAGIRILRASEQGGGNALYVMLMEDVRPGADYEPLGLLSKTIAPGPQHAAQATALWTRYRGAFVSGPSKLSLTPLAAKPAGERRPSAALEAGAKLSFTTPVGLILVHIKPEQTGVFEEMAVKIIVGVRDARDRDFKTQMSGLQIFRVVEPSPEGQVMYVVLIDPVTPNAEYEPFQVLAKTMTAEQLRAPETAEMWTRYLAAFGSGMNKLSLTPVGGLETAQTIR